MSELRASSNRFARFAGMIAAASAVFALSIVAAPGARAGGPIALPGGLLIYPKVESIVEQRFVNIVRQSQDLSCGAAAMATVLQHYYGKMHSEQSIILDIFNKSPEEVRARISASGFSMLELKRYYESLGLVAGGFRVPEVADLKNLAVPAITLVNVRGYNHFVVIKRLEGDHVLLADPAFGNLRVENKVFESEWNHVILVAVDPAGAPANMAFLDDRTIRARPKELNQIDVLARSASVRPANEY